LVAMNPAALKTNIGDLHPGGTLIVNGDAFEKSNLTKAHYSTDPLLDPQVTTGFHVHSVPMTRLTRDAVEGLGLSQREADRCKNFFALGLVYWLYDRDPAPTREWILDKFGKKPQFAEANLRALQAGINYGDSTEAFTSHYRVAPAKLPPGRYRKIMGNEALAYAMAAAAKLSGKEVVYSGYPITPASDILHNLSELKNFGIKTFQAEDEIAAVTATIGAAFGGSIAVTGSSGPGIALKGEGLGLAVMTELPLVVIDVQRGGPSTGLPTKTEQSDLLLAMFGRNGDCPMPILAAQSPGDCFAMMLEAIRIAVGFMTPVFLLTDGYIANGAEPWSIPKISELEPIVVKHPTSAPSGESAYLPYLRDERLVRPWAIPGTAGLEHRIGGIEKADVTGNICYDAENHEHMTRIRRQKVANIADAIPPQHVEGPASGDVLLVSWGGTFGAVRTAAAEARRRGHQVSHCHLRYLNPFPKNLGQILTCFRRVLVPELNSGQLRLLLRSTFLVDAIGVNKVQGKPFLVSELLKAVEQAVLK
ncbi:MAG TPA: 2-oxoacid:acceptor oxidoreductase subunit alpha, partial [Caulifigura sp.]|nr:2-oxoacid:acceptor oxidoreductase subunit alpha [Caulifigura sp.]